jgi:hypothetical protein
MNFVTSTKFTKQKTDFWNLVSKSQFGSPVTLSNIVKLDEPGQDNIHFHEIHAFVIF